MISDFASGIMINKCALFRFQTEYAKVNQETEFHLFYFPLNVSRQDFRPTKYSILC